MLWSGLQVEVMVEVHRCSGHGSGARSLAVSVSGIASRRALPLALASQSRGALRLFHYWFLASSLAGPMPLCIS